MPFQCVFATMPLRQPPQERGTIMKTTKLLLLAVLAFAMLACAAQAEEITAEALNEAVRTVYAIDVIDVRPEEVYSAGAIPSASNIPLDQLESTVKSILERGYTAMDAPVYVYGETADDSAAAADILAGLGFTGVRFLPGIGAWTYPLEVPGLLLGNLVTTDIYGNAVDSSLIADQKLVMVNIWGTYCNPCISEMQGLGALGRSLKDEGVMILGLVVDCSNKDLSPNEGQLELARLIAEKTQADYPHVLPTMTMYRNFLTEVQSVPTTFFVDGAGRKVGSVFLGARDEAAWLKIINETLAGLE